MTKNEADSLRDRRAKAQPHFDWVVQRRAADDWAVLRLPGSVLREISNQVHATRPAVLAQVTEQSPEVIDAAMERLGGDVMRRPVVEVEQEIAAAQGAQRKAEREARKEAAHAKVEELKSKLHRAEARAAA